MTKKIVYFTAGQYATTAELSAIEKLNAAAEAEYSIAVMNGAAAADTTYGELLKDCDYVAGTVPDPYSGVATIDPDNLPVQGLESTQAIVNNADVFSILPATGTTPIQGEATVSVSNQAISGIRLAATAAVINNGQTFSVTGGTVTINVSGNAATATFTAS